MTDWLQFSLLDMTPYDREGWLWLLASYQQDYPYLPLLSLLHSMLLAVLLLRPVPYAPRLALGLLALSWFWCGWVFQLQYHASMNWAAMQIGWAFIAQAGLLMLVAIGGKALMWCHVDWRNDWPGFLVLLLALLYPLFGGFEGRKLQQLAWPGLMAQPVTLTTLGVLMLLRSRYWLLLLPIPLLWALVSAAFTWKLGLLEPYITAVALLALIVTVFYRRRKSGG